MSEHAIVQSILSTAKAGDKSAEQELFKYLLVRFSIIAKQRIEGDDAEDIAQDACLTAIQKYKDEAPDEKFEPWAYNILRNKIGNYYQHRTVRRKIIVEHGLHGQGEQEQAVERDLDKARQLVDCLRKLIRVYKRYARVLNLVYLGYTTEEICMRLKLNRGNYYMILKRGRKLLSQCLENEE